MEGGSRRAPSGSAEVGEAEKRTVSASDKACKIKVQRKDMESRRRYAERSGQGGSQALTLNREVWDRRDPTGKGLTFASILKADCRTESASLFLQAEE